MILDFFGCFDIPDLPRFREFAEAFRMQNSRHRNLKHERFICCRTKEEMYLQMKSCSVLQQEDLLSEHRGALVDRREGKGRGCNDFGESRYSQTHREMLWTLKEVAGGTPKKKQLFNAETQCGI